MTLLDTVVYEGVAGCCHRPQVLLGVDMRSPSYSAVLRSLVVTVLSFQLVLLNAPPCNAAEGQAGPTATDAPAVAATQPFHSKKYGYSLDLPRDWVRVPDEVVDTFKSTVMNPGAAKKIVYDAAFQYGRPQRWLTLPYVLVQVVPYASMGPGRQISESEMGPLVKAVTGFDAKKLFAERVRPEARGIIKKAEFGEPVLDMGAHRFSLTYDSEVKNVGQVRGSLTGYFGRAALVLINFYCLKSLWAREAGESQAIADSFRFDADKAYSPLLNALEWLPFVPGGNVWEKILAGAIFGALFGLAVALVRSVRNRFRRQRSAEE